MLCPRCNSPACNNTSGGEYSLLCTTCGYFTARVIDTFVDNVPIYRYIEQKPLGVIVTKEKNIQYYTPYQKNNILLNEKCIGYTERWNGEWMFYDTKHYVHIPLDEVADILF